MAKDYTVTVQLEIEVNADSPHIAEKQILERLAELLEDLDHDLELIDVV
jgi:hypothetical protein